MLKLTEVSLYRDNLCLAENINLSLQPGEALQITGANGSGKSTFAAAIAGDYQNFTGNISWEGYKKPSIKELNKLRGVLLQELEVNFPITVIEFVALAGSNTESSISKLRLDALQDKKITELSQGQLQKAHIAQLINQDPVLFILDEPFAAQDKENTELLTNLFLSLKTEGKSLIIINHIELELHGLVDKMFFLSAVTNPLS